MQRCTSSPRQPGTGQLATSQLGPELDVLVEERFRIQRQYTELDNAILHGQGSPRILDNARALVHLLLAHLTHEEQLRKERGFSILEDQRTAWKQNMAELLLIEAGLKQAEVYAALRLRGFCKGWIHEHIYENDGAEFDLPAVAGFGESGRAQA